MDVAIPSVRSILDQSICKVFRGEHSKYTDIFIELVSRFVDEFLTVFAKTTVFADGPQNIKWFYSLPVNVDFEFSLLKKHGFTFDQYCQFTRSSEADQEEILEDRHLDPLLSIVENSRTQSICEALWAFTHGIEFVNLDSTDEISEKVDFLCSFVPDDVSEVFNELKNRFFDTKDRFHLREIVRIFLQWESFDL